MCTHTSHLPPVCLSVYVSGMYIFTAIGRLNSARLVGERLPAPLVYVLGNTIWPQVLSIYLKPSVSFLVLTVSRVSSHFHPPFPTHYPQRRRHLGRNGRGVRGGGVKKKLISRPGPGKTKME